MIAYHFISKKYALDVISNQCMKLSLVSDLNDPFELLAADLSTNENRKGITKFKNQMASKVGILCFSTNWKNPLLWSHYADRHKGVSLIFELLDSIALPVIYRQERYKINYTEKMILNQPLTQREIEGLWLTKFSSWNYEEEIRVICGQSECFEKNNLLFYPLNYQISLKGIIIGPLCNLEIVKIRDKLPIGKELEITKSRLAFKSFNIVEQKLFKKIKIKN